MSVQLKDMLEVQDIPFPYQVSPELIRITILSVYPGTEFNDTCLSEISLSPITLKPYKYHTFFADGHFESNGTYFAGLYARGSMEGLTLLHGEWGYTSGGYLFIKGYYHFGWTSPDGDENDSGNHWKTTVFSPDWHSLYVNNE